MIKTFLFFVLVIFLFSGCYDTFYGPKIKNGFATSIEITITYADGEISMGSWPSGHTAFIGKSDNMIQEIVIKKDGEIIHELDSENVSRLVEKEKSYNGYSVWSITPDGIIFINGK